MSSTMIDARADLAGGYLRSTPDTVLLGELPCASDTPVTSVNPGDVITIDTVSHEGILPDQGSDPRAFFARFGVPESQVLPDAIDIAESGRRPAGAGPHVVTGPIAVPGARPGDLLAVTVIDLVRRADYGIVSSRHGRGALPDRFPAEDVTSVFCLANGDVGSLPMVQDESAFAGGGRAIRFPLRPFLGITGVASADGVRPNSVPPGLYGGNLDITHLGVGSTLFLPVQVPDALLYVGDPHYAQGDGEVALTAFEAPLRGTLRVEVVPGGASTANGRPFAETSDLLIAIGLDADLDEACRDSVRGALELIEHRYGVPAGLAYAYLSAAADVRISQVVDQVKGCHTVIRKDDFREWS
ncbi:acetamidase/formamidase family protein [Gordonia sp. PP30]|uniref:acetamidase/formamidase family protein n=1 Tax=unclassified Gordonia (in: high G+C Gram-positive bacteria) TaxID=2657482 RepID=UPI001FFFB142|nr:acetamidase/formamidase family protein [Gordonia sp. PP30]UQE74171.1 acetamidase/formamidase family protein [Gordonia sp. PP30]